MVAILHQTDEQLELYALGRLPEPLIAAVEEHLLVCVSCRERLDDIGSFALAMRAAIAGKPNLTDEKRWIVWLKTHGNWRSAPLFAGGFAMIVLLCGILFHSPGNIAAVASIELSAMRGDMLSVKSALETDIVLADAPAGSPVSAEVVDATGNKVWTGVLEGKSCKVQIAKQLAPGNYFVRLYDKSRILLHEYGFRVL